MQRDGLSGFELAVLTVGGVAALVVAVVWAGAALALLVVGHPVEVSFGQAADALPELAGRFGDPAGAWPATIDRRLPRPALYWARPPAAPPPRPALRGLGRRVVG